MTQFLPSNDSIPSVPPELIQRRAKIFRQWGDDLERLTVQVRQPQLLGVQGEAGDERTFGFAAGGAVVALELAEEDRLRGAVKRIDRQRQRDVREMDADLVR